MGNAEETILRLQAIEICRVRHLNKRPDLSCPDHFHEEEFGPGEEFDVPFSEAAVLIATRRAKLAS
jgi:hypothetical protein